MRQCLELPGSAQAVLISIGLEDGNDCVDDALSLLGCSFVDAQELQELLLDQRMRVRAIVLGRSGELSRLRKDGLCIAP